MITAPYKDRVAALATMHGKQTAMAWPLRCSLGLSLVVPPSLNTDALGTFSGETPRTGTPLETALRKARLGMEAARLPLGLANEGSFGPHPAIPLITGDHEVMVFLDDEQGLSVTESILSAKTNASEVRCHTVEQALEFAHQAGFPSHALIVRPFGNADPALIEKGLREDASISTAVKRAIATSPERVALVETDMRAHCNPTRMRVIRKLTAKLARRLRTLCPACGCPGFGLTSTLPGLPCEDCACPTDLVLQEIHECHHCDHQMKLPRADQMKTASARYCPECNP